MNNKQLIPALLLTGSFVLAAATGTYAQKTLSKEVSQEVPSQKGSLIRLVTSSRKVILKPWDQSKVKVTMEISYDSSLARKVTNDADWFETFGVNIKPFSNRVDILTGTSSGATVTRLKTTSQSLYYSDGQGAFKKPSAVAIGGQGSHNNVEGVTVVGYKTTRPTVELMTIMVPAGCKLDLENKYGDIVIGMNVDEAKLKVSNGALDAQDIKDLKLEGTYCNANLGNIEKAEIEFSNGTFRAQNISDLDMDTKSSTVEYEKGKYLYLRSQNDNLTIDAIDKIDGRKVYGSLKIDQLNSSFDLEGNNVDIKFRNISPEVTLIKINNKYGDVRLPVKGLTNYYVDFIGNYSTVFAPFQKEVVKEEEKKPVEGETATKVVIDEAKYTYTRKGTSLGEVAPRHFTSTVGDTKGKHTRIELTCHSCTVDFK